ncbi:MAG: hypothetical protein A2007_04435 [Verrucomicrobia bacterium GWC2_42_7]|nr:MAG: hypothetical protein A2007_04435 [Verrucomicrobia bacterium GWC2_42_7]
MGKTALNRLKAVFSFPGYEIEMEKPSLLFFRENNSFSERGLGKTFLGDYWVSPNTPISHKKSAFTLLEVVLAVSIFVTMTILIVAALPSTLDHFKKQADSDCLKNEIESFLDQVECDLSSVAFVRLPTDVGLKEINNYQGIMYDGQTEKHILHIDKLSRENFLQITYQAIEQSVVINTRPLLNLEPIVEPKKSKNFSIQGQFCLKFHFSSECTTEPSDLVMYKDGNWIVKNSKGVKELPTFPSFIEIIVSQSDNTKASTSRKIRLYVQEPLFIRKN